MRSATAKEHYRIYIVGGSFYSTFKFWLSTIKSKDKSDKLLPFTVAPQGP